MNDGQGHLRRGNLLWEGSRMMLPEHKEQLLDHRRDHGKRERPLLDEQRLELWSGILAEGLQDGLEIAVTVYDPFGDTRLQGTVERIDPAQRRIKLVRSSGPVWIRLSDVTAIDWP